MSKTLLGVAMIIGIVATTPLQAELPPPFAEFTFRRVKPPASGATRRITVQIDPEAQRVALAPRRPDPDSDHGPDPSSGPGSDLGSEPSAPLERQGDAHDWFWSRIEGASPALRLGSALVALQSGGVAAPRLQALRRIADLYGSEILNATVGTRVSPAFALAVISVESGGRPDALSRAGAQGLMQLMPDTATRFGVADRTVAADNIRAGVSYLDWLMGRFEGDPLLALAGYNAGEGAVDRHGGVPPFAETRGYVPKVLAAWSVAKGLCLTPPQLISDGCVFVSGRAERSG